jgi:hypothetical protein
VISVIPRASIGAMAFKHSPTWARSLRLKGDASSSGIEVFHSSVLGRSGCLAASTLFYGEVLVNRVIPLFDPVGRPVVAHAFHGSTPTHTRARDAIHCSISASDIPRLVLTASSPVASMTEKRRSALVMRSPSRLTNDPRGLRGWGMRLLAKRTSRQCCATSLAAQLSR